MTTCRQNQRNRNGNHQRGVALVAALLTLVLIAAITAGMIIMSTTETSISANFRDEQTGFFAAKAGMEEARDRLSAFRNAGQLPTTTAGATAPTPGVLYVVNPNTANGETQNTVLTTYGDDEICKETQTAAVPCAADSMGRMVATPGAWDTTVLASNVYAPAGPVFPWKWVRVNLKQNNENNAIAPSYNTNGVPTDGSVVCWNGTNEYADPTFSAATGCTVQTNLPVYVLTAMAVTSTGTRRVVQAELAEQKFPFTAPAALTLDGIADAFSGGTASQWGSNGNDAAGCGIATTGAAVHGIGVTDTADKNNVDAGVKRASNIVGSGPNLADGANIVDVSPATGDNTLPVSLQSVSALQTLVSTMKADVTQPVINGPASGLSNPGSQGNPQIIYVNGDLTINGNITGYGVLVVTGNLTITGTPIWNGIIFVVGKGNFSTSGTAQYNGAVVVANTLNALGQPLAAFGPAAFSINGGGHGGVQYSSGCIAMATRQLAGTFQVAAIRELMR